MAVNDLYDLAAEYLAACELALASTPGGPIANGFVSAGVPVWDCCPQLSVHTGGPQIADTRPVSPPLQPGHRISTTGTVNLVLLTATILRCVPTLDASSAGVSLPAKTALSASARIIYADLWAIWNTLKTLHRAGTLFPDHCREMFIDPAISLTSEGGCGGWELPIRVELGGYRTP